MRSSRRTPAATATATSPSAGRNSYGHITVRHQGGGNRQKYRVIDFKRDKREVEGKVLRLEYDPNRSAYIALVEYADGERRYILAPVGLGAGDAVMASAAADIKPGNALPMANIPVGTVIHNIELYPGKGAQLVRSAGVAAQLMAKENGMATAARCARSAWTALPPSARSATSTTPMSTSARPAASATWVGVPLSAVLS